MIERIRARLIPADFTRQNFWRGAPVLGRAHHRDATGRRPGPARRSTPERGRSRAFVDLLASRDVTLQDGARAAPRAASVDDLNRVADAARLDAVDVLGHARPPVYLDRRARRRRAFRDDGRS